MLLVGSGLLIRSFVALMAVDPGFHTERLLTLRASLPDLPSPPPSGAPADEESGGGGRGGAVIEMVERLQRLPGVEQASAGSDTPLFGSTSASIFSVEGQPPLDASTVPRGYHHFIMPGFFATTGLKLLSGRDFAAADLRGDNTRVIISERAAQRFWPGERAAQQALGQRIKEGRPTSDSPWLTIVGVVSESRYRALPRNPTSDPDLFFPLPPTRRSFSLLLRTRLDPETLIDTVRRELRAVAPSATIYDVTTMEQRVAGQMARPRFVSWLMGVFAGVALLLAAIGVYGVMAQAVARRTQEIGIRMALGADRRDILRLVLGRGLVLIAAGVVAGAVGALLLGRLLQTLLFGVGHADPITFVSVAALLTLVALAASWIPTARAMRVDPIVALRH